MFLRTTVRLSEAELVILREHLLSLVRQAQDQPDDEGVWTRVVVTLSICRIVVNQPAKEIPHNLGQVSGVALRTHVKTSCLSTTNGGRFQCHCKGNIAA